MYKLDIGRMGAETGRRIADSRVYYMKTSCAQKFGSRKVDKLGSRTF